MARQSRKVEALLREHLRRLGSRGGKARVAKQTPQERRESARNAALARWSKRK
jgi:hypothetical protein